MFRAIRAIGRIFDAGISALLEYTPPREQQAQELALRLREAGLDPEAIVRDKALIETTERLVRIAYLGELSIPQAFSIYAMVAAAKVKKS